MEKSSNRSLFNVMIKECDVNNKQDRLQVRRYQTTKCGRAAADCQSIRAMCQQELAKQRL
ncbi:hypothetical protein BLOT_000494 [Blomia tropicalis]|nr:hypothetical protein BLOT_000494 [Blomia tropicalis]